MKHHWDKIATVLSMIMYGVRRVAGLLHSRHVLQLRCKEEAQQHPTKGCDVRLLPQQEQDVWRLRVMLGVFTDLDPTRSILQRQTAFLDPW